MVGILNWQKNFLPVHGLCGYSSRHDDLISVCGLDFSLMRLIIQGFVNNMSEYMLACDCIITKAGPGTIAEALICGRPILLNGDYSCSNFVSLGF